MPFCKECGTSIDADVKFCPDCGTPTAKTKSANTVPVIAPPRPVTPLYATAAADRTMVHVAPLYGRIDLENLPAGHIIDDRYEIKSKLGQGGFGAVYRAYDTSMKVDKALKIIPDMMFGDREAMENLRHEAMVMLKLNHQNIVRVYDLHESGPIKYIDMELVSGASLADIKLNSPDKKLTEAIVCAYALQIADGMAYAHSLSVIHRDIKPQNILLDNNGIIKIMDFGIAETVRSSMSRISNRPSTGTLVYMSPEQLIGENVGRQSDIYSFGAMLYELLNGKPPFWQGDIQYQIVKKEPAPLTIVSESLNRVILQCLAKESAARPADFDSVKKLLVPEVVTVPPPVPKCSQPAAADVAITPETPIVPSPIQNQSVNKKKGMSLPAIISLIFGGGFLIAIILIVAAGTMNGDSFFRAGSTLAVDSVNTIG